MRHASTLRVFVGYCCVIARKMGLPARGSTMGNSALIVSRKTLTASATYFSLAHTTFIGLVNPRAKAEDDSGSSVRQRERHLKSSITRLRIHLNVPFVLTHDPLHGIKP